MSIRQAQRDAIKAHTALQNFDTRTAALAWAHVVAIGLLEDQADWSDEATLPLLTAAAHQHAAAAMAWAVWIHQGDPDGAPGYAAQRTAAAWQADAAATAAMPQF